MSKHALCIHIYICIHRERDREIIAYIQSTIVYHTDKYRIRRHQFCQSIFFSNCVCFHRASVNTMLVATSSYPKSGKIAINSSIMQPDYITSRLLYSFSRNMQLA